MATDSLFIIGAGIAFRCLESILVLPRQAAVGENELPNRPRPNFGKRGKYSVGNAGSFRGRVGRGVFCGRHGRDKGDGGSTGQGSGIKRAWDVMPCSSLVQSYLLGNDIPGFD